MNALQILDIEEIEQEKESFKVTDLESATWCLRKISALQSKIEEVKAVADKEITRVNDWANSEIEKSGSSIEYMEHLLSQYILEQKAIDPKFKVSTPYGTVSTRKQQPKWEYDDSTVLQFLKSHSMNDFIRIKEEVDKANLKKSVQIAGDTAITPDGEVIEGLKIIEQPESVVIKAV